MKSSPLNDLPFRTFVLAPPYDLVHQVAAAELPEASRVIGGVVMLEAGERSRLPSHLRTWIPKVRQTLLDAPVVLRLAGPSRLDDLHHACIAGSLRVRAVLAADEPLLPMLRERLTRPTDLAADVAEYLTLKQPRLDPRLGRTIQVLLSAAPERVDLGAALRRAAEHDHTVRSWTRHAHLPSPGAFLRLGRLLPMLLELQRHPDSSVAEMLHRHETSDVASFRHQVCRLFGFWPSVVSGTLGWEWIADRFLRRHHAGFR